MKTSCRKSLFFLAITFALVFRMHAGASSEEVFTKIYDNKVWGTNEEGKGTSGGGSLLSTTEVYRNFIQDFLKTYHIRSVVDLGCGDWEFSKAMNWDGIHYIGIDVVKSLIESNQAKYSKENIEFRKADGVSAELPEADLFICKDVLQHLPHEDILILAKQFVKFKYCLITNDVNRFLTSANPQIKRGEYRPLDLTRPPFSFKGTKVLTYVSGPTTKQVLLLIREN